ncbi:MAG: prepilin peptidase [Planctomycetota bacterium]
MTTLLALLATGMGAIVGSFLNVVIYRLPRSEPMGMVRSKCPSCGTIIRWFDNIPLVSYLALLGRCRDCRWRIPLRYPLVEALTAVLFGLCVLRVDALSWEPPLLAWAVCVAFAAILIAASAIDFTHKLLPDKLTLIALPVVGLIGSLGVPSIHGTVLFGHPLEGAVKAGMASLVVGLAGAVVGGGIILAVRQIGTLIVRREAMGLGDVKFMAACGLLLGPGATLLAIGCAMVSGAFLGVLIWILTRNREIPFGPFLALGALAMLLYGGPIEHFVLEVYPTWVRGG